MDAGRRHDTPGKEAKDFNTYDPADSMKTSCSWNFCLLGPILGYRAAQEDAVHAQCESQLGNPCLLRGLKSDITIIIIALKQIYPHLCHPRLFAIQACLKR